MTRTINVDGKDLNPAQRAFLASRANTVLVSAGFGAGKTTGGAIKILQLSTANRGIPGLIVAPTYGVLKSTILRGLGRMLGHKLKIIDPQGERFISLDSKGTPIFLRSADAWEYYDGLDVGWGYGDELRHWIEKAYQVFISRIRVKCPYPQRALTSTPDMRWMAREFASGPREGLEVIYASTEENARNLEPTFLRDLRGSYSSRMQDAFIGGQFVFLDGAVYDTFDRSVNVIDYDASKFTQAKTYLGIDPGLRRSAVIWARDLGDMRWIIFRQLMLDNVDMIGVIERINAINRSNGISVDEIWVDPAADNRDETTGFSALQALRTLHCRNNRPIRAIKRGTIFHSISWGVERTRAMLGDKEASIKPRLYISSACDAQEKDSQRGVIRSLQAYSYPEVKDGRPVVDVPLKDGTYDHACDAVRYLAVGLWLSTPLRNLLRDSTIAASQASGYETR